MKANAKKSESSSLSFGMIPEESNHHFLVNLGDRKGPYIYISEHFEYYANPERQRIEYNLKPNDSKMRVILPYEKWKLIEEPIQFDLNQRLKRTGLKSSKFKAGNNYLPRLFGKEIILLCWAIEDADPAVIPIAIKNWQGLKPEERWWLYTMTNAATGQAVKGRGLGWRKAVRYALTENPVEFVEQETVLERE
ncbi:MAG: DUF3780 domain-containing protein [Leptospiraceae bacterium]|nr:DUF3780 domain-containing protein [Leptospiraceae bacterium]